MRLLRLVPVALTAALALAAAPGAHAQTAGEPKQEVAEQDQVRAQLDYVKQESEYSDVRLTIVRGSKTVLDHAPVAPPCDGCPTAPLGGSQGSSLTLRDLDGDGELELIVDFFTGGAHCCFYSEIYDYVPATDSYVTSFADWGNGGYLLRNVDHRGPPELQTADDKFAYAFSCYACSVRPVLIYSYRDGGSLVDVTLGRGRATVRNELTKLLRTYRHPGRTDMKGLFPALVGDAYRLGKNQLAIQLLRSGVKHNLFKSNGFPPNGAAYAKKLKSFLRANGYIHRKK